MATAPTSSAVFPALVQQYGFKTALALLPLLDPNASTTTKAFAGGSLAGSGAQAAGSVSGTPALSALGSNIGLGLGLAGLGYGAYNTATNPNLSPGQKGASIGGGVGGAVASYATPWGAIPGIAAAVGDQLQRSGSPQIQGLGRGLTSAGRPVPNVTKSPTDVGWLKGFNETMIEGGPGIKAILNAIGFDPFGSTPTKGTEFRTDLQTLFKKLGLPGFDRANSALYNAPKGGYGAYDPAAVSLAHEIGTRLAGLSPVGKKNLPAYGTQGENILLSLLGNNVTTQGPGILARIGGTGSSTAPQAGQAVLPSAVGQRLRSLI